MSRQVFRNNVFTKLAGAITDDQTVFQVADGSVFYSPGTNEHAVITLQSKNIRSQVEVVQLVSVSGNTITVVRGIEGAQFAFAANDVVEQRVTAGSLDNFLQTEDVATSDTPPVNPRKDQRWIDSTDGAEYFWYDNGTSQQWVEVGTQVYGTDPAPPPAVTAYDMYQDQQIALLAADVLTLGGADVVSASYNALTKDLTITKADLSTVVCPLAAVDADKLDGQEGSYFEERDVTAIGSVGNTITLTRTAGNLQVILSALEADTLNGQNGAFYQNAGNMNAGTLPTARLAGSYNITADNAIQLDNQNGAFYRNASNLNAGVVPNARLPVASLLVPGISEFATSGEITNEDPDRVITATEFAEWMDIKAASLSAFNQWMEHDSTVPFRTRLAACWASGTSAVVSSPGWTTVMATLPCVFDGAPKFLGVMFNSGITETNRIFSPRIWFVAPSTVFFEIRNDGGGAIAVPWKLFAAGFVTT